ncbi:MAG: hypothetical protein Rubg2KO_40650 [Rubricoccaceae bacterium]
MVRTLCLLAIVCLLGACDSTPEANPGPDPEETPAPGTTQFGTAAYVESIVGDLPIILSAPHGGDLRPETIPDRTQGTTINDANTQELARAIQRALIARTGRHPHVVINRLHRSKLDANRDLAEAAQGNPDAERAWTEFHAFTDSAKTRVTEDWGAGLYLDLHGHGHAIQRLELGILLSRTELNSTDAQLNGLARESSLRALASSVTIPFSDLVRGPNSLGALLEAQGVRAVPSDADPRPLDDPYFTGGYNTVRHGSRDGGPISSIQIEHHRPGLRDTQANRNAYAEQLADALIQFMQAHYGFELSASP